MLNKTGLEQSFSIDGHEGEALGIIAEQNGMTTQDFVQRMAFEALLNAKRSCRAAGGCQLGIVCPSMEVIERETTRPQGYVRGTIRCGQPEGCEAEKA